MYINLVFFEYLASVFSGLMGCVFLAVIAVKGSGRDWKYRYAFLFMAASLLYRFLYFLFYYREIVLGEMEFPLPYRVLDYIISCSIAFFWILLLEHLGDGEKKKTGAVPAAAALTITRTVASCVMAICFMDGYYYIGNQPVARALSVIGTGSMLLMTILILDCCRKAARASSLSAVKIYIIFVSAALILAEIPQEGASYMLYFENLGASAWSLETFDPTGPLFLLINLATLLYIFQAFVSKAFVNTENSRLYESQERKRPEDLLDLAAEYYKLTKREREVAGLVYEGLSNPDIVDKLCISRNTVKQHVQNIYGKLGVSTRIELIHLINSQK